MINLKPFAKKAIEAIKGRKTFLALTACIVAVGGAGVYAYNRTVDNLNDKLLNPSKNNSSQAQDVNAGKDNVLKEDSLSSELQEILDADTQPRVFPIDGEIASGFSDGELVYSETLGVWQTHNGIDILAEKGEEVLAMTKGVVEKVWEDALWGYCVTIDHENSVVSHYYGLDANLSVQQGDKVDSGDVIGTVGNTASAEITMPSHIHFALKRNGEWVDPVHYISPNSHK